MASSRWLLRYFTQRHATRSLSSASICRLSLNFVCHISICRKILKQIFFKNEDGSDSTNSQMHCTDATVCEILERGPISSSSLPHEFPARFSITEVGTFLISIMGRLLIFFVLTLTRDALTRQAFTYHSLIIASALKGIGTLKTE
jgi:hypothetical protein